MEVQGRAKRECFVTAVTDEPVKFTDTATKVCFTPDLDRKPRRIKTSDYRLKVKQDFDLKYSIVCKQQFSGRIPVQCEQISCRRNR